MKKSSLLLLGIGVIVALLLVAGFAFWQKEQPAPQVRIEPTPQLTQTPAAQPSPDPTVNWKTYRNEEFGIEYKYPNDWVHERHPPRDAALPPNYQLYPRSASHIRIYIYPEKDNVADLRKFRESRDFHGKMKELSVGGFNGFSETFTRDQYKIGGGGNWGAKDIFIEYRKNKILVFKLKINALSSPADESLGRDTLDEIIKTLTFF